MASQEAEAIRASATNRGLSCDYVEDRDENRSRARHVDVRRFYVIVSFPPRPAEGEKIPPKAYIYADSLRAVQEALRLFSDGGRQVAELEHTTRRTDFYMRVSKSGRET